MPIDFDCSIESCSSSSPQTYSCQSMSQLFGPSKKPSSVTIFHMMSFLIVRIPPPSHLRELLFKASQGQREHRGCLEERRNRTGVEPVAPAARWTRRRGAPLHYGSF